MSAGWETRPPVDEWWAWYTAWVDWRSLQLMHRNRLWRWAGYAPAWVGRILGRVAWWWEGRA